MTMWPGVIPLQSKFHRTSCPHPHTDMDTDTMTTADWASLPHDVLTKIIGFTDNNPAQFAGVCKHWRGVTEDPANRKEVTFGYSPDHRLSAQEVARSFSLYLCTREPVTVELTVCVHPVCASLIAALGAVVTHLAPSLKILHLDPSGVCDVFLATPCIGQSAAPAPAAPAAPAPAAPAPAAPAAPP